ncbi:MAG: 4-alpha-glucanotransferase [Fusobacteriaceae bacterium]|jgi:4-alpha-glucanotransferase|nr:4-alpha-glucanotransferase [Fusobacteriaceae bacterium]
MIERSSGILLHVSSLPGEYGIGDLGENAYKFVDFLKDCKQKIWQMLPLVPVGYGNSPYQSVSVFAGNPLFIDLAEFVTLGYISEEELGNLKKINNIKKVLYEEVAIEKEKILNKIYSTFSNNNGIIYEKSEFSKFVENNSKWLKEYAVFMVLKKKFNNRSWRYWPRIYKFKSKRAIKNICIDYAERVQYYYFEQYIFYKQFNKLKKYANDNGIKIFGDIPIYVSTDSADAWGNMKLFQFTKFGKPKRVAGCPPDYFSKTGQLWGNILYDWDKMRKQKYTWWINRLKHSFEIYDIVRLDHFIGFDSYWSIPAEDKTAIYGRREKGPGMELFEYAEKKLGKLSIVAEDLGALTESVRNLLKQTKFPGMKILEFAFDSYDSDYLPHKYNENSFAYTGTHDNNTVNGWFSENHENIKNYAIEYINNYTGEYSNDIPMNIKMIMALLKSNARGVIVPVQDYLGIGSEGRMNVPSTVGANWEWRLGIDMIHSGVSENIKNLISKYNR